MLLKPAGGKLKPYADTAPPVIHDVRFLHAGNADLAGPARSPASRSCLRPGSGWTSRPLAGVVDIRARVATRSPSSARSRSRCSPRHTTRTGSAGCERVVLRRTVCIAAQQSDRDRTAPLRGLPATARSRARASAADRLFQKPYWNTTRVTLYPGHGTQRATAPARTSRSRFSELRLARQAVRPAAPRARGSSATRGSATTEARRSTPASTSPHRTGRPCTRSRRPRSIEGPPNVGVVDEPAATRVLAHRRPTVRQGASRKHHLLGHVAPLGARPPRRAHSTTALLEPVAAGGMTPFDDFGAPRSYRRIVTVPAASCPAYRDCAAYRRRVRPPADLGASAVARAAGDSPALVRWRLVHDGRASCPWRWHRRPSVPSRRHSDVHFPEIFAGGTRQNHRTSPACSGSGSRAGATRAHPTGTAARRRSRRRPRQLIARPLELMLLNDEVRPRARRSTAERISLMPLPPPCASNRSSPTSATAAPASARRSTVSCTGAQSGRTGSGSLSRSTGPTRT